MNRFKNVIVLVLVCLVFFQLNAQKEKPEDFIIWSDSIKLEWKDFEGHIGKYHSAITNAGISVKSESKENVFFVRIQAKFYKKKSWVLVEKKSNLKILAHEQIHFDIVELYSRKLRKSLSCNKKLNRVTPLNLKP